MAINTTTLEASLQTKLDATTNTTESKEFLLLGKALEAVTPTVTLSDITTEGATQVGTVSAEGTTQVGAVNAAGATNLAGILAIGGIPAVSPAVAGLTLSNDGQDAIWKPTAGATIAKYLINS